MHAKSDHAILFLEHSTALHHIYTQEHTSTHLHPSRTAFLSNFSLLLSYSPRYLSISLTPSLFPDLPVSRCFSQYGFPCQILFTVSLYFYLYLFLSLFPPLSPSLSVSLSLSLSPTGRKPHRPPFSPAPFLLLVRMVNWWPSRTISAASKNRDVHGVCRRYRRRIGRG